MVHTLSSSEPNSECLLLVMERLGIQDPRLFSFGPTLLEQSSQCIIPPLQWNIEKINK